MANRDEGIRNLIPGIRTPDEIKEDQNTKKYIDTVLSQVDPVLELDPLETFLRATPTINLKSTPKVETKETIDDVLKHQTKGAERIRKARQDPEWVAEHNKRFGRISKTTVLPKDKGPNEKMGNSLKALKEYHHPTPVGLGNKYKSDLRTPVQIKRDSHNAKVEASKGNYIPWYDRMAQEEAEKLNRIKKMAWEESSVKSAEPKKLTAQDIKNVYDKK